MPRGSKQCCGTTHGQSESLQKLTIINTEKDKSVKHDVIHYMRSNKLMGPRGKYICQVCYHYGKDKFDNIATDNPVPSQAKRSKTDISVQVDEIIHLIHNDMIETTQLKKLAYAIGKSQHKYIMEDAKNISKVYTDANNLADYEHLRTMETFNPVIYDMLTGLTGTEIVTDTKLMFLITIIECIYKTVHNNTIAPLSFSVNLMNYLVTGSDIACNMIGSLIPGGCYTTIWNFLESNSQHPLISTNVHDMITFFDNSQVIGRTWNVHLGHNKQKMSCITSMIHINSNLQTDIQVTSDLSPAKWLNWFDTSSVIDNLIVQSHETFDKLQVEFKIFKEKLVMNSFEVAKVELRNTVLGTIADNAQITITKSDDGILSGHKKNTSCDIYPNEIFNNITHHVPSVGPQVMMGEPCLVNPNSYQTVCQVGKHIQTTAIGDRKWTAIGCDGNPYLIMRKLQQTTFHCPQYKIDMTSTGPEFVGHMSSVHNVIINAKEVIEYLTFNNILLLTGAGHFEMNMLRCIIKFAWEPIFQSVANLMGFRSPKAEKCAKACTDHHKGWQMFIIAFTALQQELTFSYIRYCQNEGSNPTPAGFHQFGTNAKSPRYVFLHKLTYKYMMALYMYRIAVRRNNSLAMMSARHTFAPLIFIANHRKYQEIHVRDLLIHLESPPAVRTFIEDNEAFSEDGDNTLAEGGDFRLELRNKWISQMVGPGVPSDNKWLRICRNLDNLKKVYLGKI